MTLEEMKNLPEIEQEKLFNQIGEERQLGKTVNYASVYGAGAGTIARAAGVPLKDAEKTLEGYWELNFSIKVIVEEQYTFKSASGDTWLVNPINGFCYSLRKESDRFSTLAQGTGSFLFDMWIDNILTLMYKRFGVKKLTGCFHDEYITNFKDSKKNREVMEEITHEALTMVNKEFKLRRELGCDIQFGRAYSDIH